MSCVKSSQPATARLQATSTDVRFHWFIESGSNGGAEVSVAVAVRRSGA